MNVAVTGASGLIGRRLVAALKGGNHSVRALSRRARPDQQGANTAVWDAGLGEASGGALDGADAVVHLAAENLAQRWTEAAKRRIRDSRVAGTRALVQAMSGLSRPPAALISASAVGYYGSRGDEVLTEGAAPGSGFLAELCDAWEREAQAAESFGVRVVRMRAGVVLDANGGALSRMLLPFRLGLGGRVGDGRQWMSWIHIDDLASLYRFALETPIAGAVNAAAPNPERNSDFVRELARALRRPALFPMPAFALRAIFGEMGTVLLDSQRVLPAAAQAAGFRFRFPELGAAFRDLLEARGEKV